MILSLEEIEKRIADSYELPNRVLEEIPEPVVSVRTSTYNHGPFIKECIEGILMQKTSFPFEFIIGEDFSTDETREIVFEYARRYPNIIRVVTADYNVGSKVNGQRCIRRCRGKYMAICEGDDYWIDPLKLQKQVDFLENNNDYILVYTNVYKVNCESKYIRKNSIKGVSGNITKYFFEEGNPIITPTACFHMKNLWAYYKEIENIPFTLKMGDLPLWIYLSRYGKVKYLKEKTTAYRVLVESASHSLDKNKLVSFLENARDILLYFNKTYKVGVSENLIEKKYYLNLIRNMALFDVHDFISYYWKGICKFPSLALNVKLLFLFVIRAVLGKKY